MRDLHSGGDKGGVDRPSAAHVGKAHLSSQAQGARDTHVRRLQLQIRRWNVQRQQQRPRPLGLKQLVLADITADTQTPCETGSEACFQVPSPTNYGKIQQSLVYNIFVFQPS